MCQVLCSMHENARTSGCKRGILTVEIILLSEIIEEEDKSKFTCLDCQAGHGFGQECLQKENRILQLCIPVMNLYYRF